MEVVEKKIAELQDANGDVNIVWIKASVDEEKLKLEEIKSKKPSALHRDKIN